MCVSIELMRGSIEPADASIEALNASIEPPDTAGEMPGFATAVLKPRANRLAALSGRTALLPTRHSRQHTADLRRQAFGREGFLQELVLAFQDAVAHHHVVGVA